MIFLGFLLCFLFLWGFLRPTPEISTHFPTKKKANVHPPKEKPQKDPQTWNTPINHPQKAPKQKIFFSKLPKQNTKTAKEVNTKITLKNPKNSKKFQTPEKKTKNHLKPQKNHSKPPKNHLNLPKKPPNTPKNHPNPPPVWGPPWGHRRRCWRIHRAGTCTLRCWETPACLPCPS